MPRIPLNLLALGTAGVTAATWFETHSVWKSAVASVSCAAVAFGQKIWTELEPQWVKRIATWLDGWASTLLAGYSKRYFKHLYFKHRTLDLRGLSIQGKFALELESLYVDLSVDSAVCRARHFPTSSEPEKYHENAEHRKTTKVAAKIANVSIHAKSLTRLLGDSSRYRLGPA
jgi:hypothetical protein